MSNRVTFQVTKFTDLNEALEEVESHYGYRIHDDYGQEYNNIYEKSDLPRTPEEAVKILREEHSEIFIDAVMVKQGFYFNDEWVILDEEGNVKNA